MGKLKKWFLRAVFAFLILIAFYIAGFFYYFGYPQYVTQKAHDSVVIGNDVMSLFDQQGVFLNLALKGHFNILSIKKDKQECFSIKYVPKKSYAAIFSFDRKLQSLSWSGKMEDLDGFLKQHQKDIQECNNICAIFMPTYLYGGSFCVYYDSHLKIISKEKPRFRD